MKRFQLLLTIITLICDQISKVFICSYITKGTSLKIINNFFYLTPNNNYGASWGLFQNHNILLIIISIIALFILLRYSYSFKSNKKNDIAFSILVGGIAGNLIDRIFLGYVRDFLDFRIFDYNFPIFNLADSFIVIGVVCLIIAIIKGEDKNGNSSKNKKRKN